MVMLLLAVLAPCVARAENKIGRPLPALSDYPLEGNIPSLDGKVVLLDFWASWCAPCKASFPAMSELYKKLSDRGLVILAVSVDDDPRAYTRFLEKTSPPFPAVRDKGHKLVASMEVPTMPTSFLIDRKGVVRFRHDGFHGNETVEAYTREIEKLLGEPAS
ncbi:MAG TPA: TlpA disulfide reductase family protein [Fimbriimonadaceae bacterium]|nr:TlpA disulfide reductase family protein [Fimbriimonadaceae bacterium]